MEKNFMHGQVAKTVYHTQSGAEFKKEYGVWYRDGKKLDDVKIVGTYDPKVYDKLSGGCINMAENPVEGFSAEFNIGWLLLGLSKKMEGKNWKIEDGKLTVMKPDENVVKYVSTPLEKIV